jgi:hypothetical protein
MGKGSARRKEDTQKIRDNWDAIFGKKDKEKAKEDVQKPAEKPDAK